MPRTSRRRVIFLLCCFGLVALVVTQSIDGSSLLSRVPAVVSKLLVFLPEGKIFRPVSGSRARYSDPSADKLFDLYRSKQHTWNERFSLHDSEHYSVFLRNLQAGPRNDTLRRLASVSYGSTSWERFYRGISQFQLYDPYTQEDSLSDLIHDLATRTVLKSDAWPEYQQTTLILTLDDGAVGIFKPKRVYEVTPDHMYFSQMERFYSEIAAFHLDRLLGFYRAPPTVGRTINITSDIKHGNLHFKYNSPVGNKCFSVSCQQWCISRHSPCGDPDIVQGSITISLPGRRGPSSKKEDLHPWSRTYNMSQAEWEIKDNYCDSFVKVNPTFSQGRFLLDLIDMAVFDFLTGNMDRGHFERFQEFGNETFTLHVDNSKGFTESEMDCPSCLVPLTQCCRLRTSTLAKILKLYQGPHSLAELMTSSLNSDPLSPVLTEALLDSLDRRVSKVLQAVNVCLEGGREWDSVVVEDGVW